MVACTTVTVWCCQGGEAGHRPGEGRGGDVPGPGGGQHPRHPGADAGDAGHRQQPAGQQRAEAGPAAGGPRQQGHGPRHRQDLLPAQEQLQGSVTFCSYCDCCGDNLD